LAQGARSPRGSRTTCQQVSRAKARMPSPCPAPGARGQFGCRRHGGDSPIIGGARAEPSRPARVKGGKQAGRRRRWGSLWSGGAGDPARAASGPRGRARAPHPGPSKDGGWGADNEHPLGFYPGRGGFSWKSHPTMNCFDLITIPPTPRSCWLDRRKMQEELAVGGVPSSPFKRSGWSGIGSF
jgi:hypothetical protein